MTHCLFQPDAGNTIPVKGEGLDRRRRRLGSLFGLVLAGLLTAGATLPAAAETGAYIIFDLASGQIFARHNADQAWYPASITKLMTTYVVFQMIKSGKLTFNSPVVVSAAAAKQPPSKMGFPVGTVITIDNALKMIMVKSANDIAWALAESAGGSKQAFVALMNDYARQIGMTETVWDNPNGLPDPSQMTTAHDMGLLARALLREFPDYDFYYRLPGIQLGNRVIRNHNHLMDHYPGADGMKTGYICASGYNVVASASRNGHRMIAVVLGSHGARPRAELAADLFNHAFEHVGGSNFFGFGASSETIDHYQPGPEANQPVKDIHAEICGGKRDTGSDESLDEASGAPAQPVNNRRGNAPILAPPREAHAELLSPHFDIGPPVKVWLGGADPAGNANMTAPIAPATAELPPIVNRPAVKPAGADLAKAHGAAAIVAPHVRAPGAIIPFPQAPTAIAAPPTETPPVPAGPSAPPAEQTPIVRAFTLFQPPAPPAAALRPTESDTGKDVPPGPDPAALHVPVPKDRPNDPVKSADVKPAKKPSKPAKTDKPKKPDTEN